MSNKSNVLVLTTDLPKLGLEIKENQKAHTKVDTEWQRLALSAIKAFGDHGNVFYINAVYGAMGKGARHVAMTEFFTQFGGVSANEGAGKDNTPFIKDKNKAVDMESATKTPWYDLKPSKKPDEVLDYLKLVMKMLEKKPGKDQEVKNAALKTKLFEVVVAYQTAATAEDGEGGAGDDGTGGNDKGADE